MGWRRSRGLTVRLLIGAFIPRSQRGGETNQRERLEMQKGESPKGLEVQRLVAVIRAVKKSEKTHSPVERGATSAHVCIKE